MGRRRKARERALQALYQMDVSGAGPDEALEAPWESPGESESASAKDYADLLVRGVSHSRDSIDETIQKHSANWRIHRMARVDRNVLRIAVFELLHQPEVPSKVVLNEAIEVAKRFGSEDSGAFINGILDKAARAIRPEPED